MAKLTGYTSIAKLGGFKVHQQNYLQIDRPYVTGDNRLHIYCSDSISRVCKLDLLDPQAQFELVELMELAWKCDNRFKLVTLDNWSPDKWFVSAIVDRLQINQVQMINHSSSIDLITKKLYKKAIKYCIDRYNLDGAGYITVFNDYIDVNRKGLRGSCGARTLHNRYIIKISTEGEGDVDVIESIFHEFRHAEQYQLGLLKGQSWMGNDCSHIDYIDQPWEIDARETATKMIEGFTELLRNERF